MLALVKMPHTEIAISGEGAGDVIEWIRRKFPILVMGEEQADDAMPLEETAFWKSMQANRIGNLLEGYRLKAGLTQAALAEKTGIRQNMLSDYETGKRPLTRKMGERLAEALGVKPERFL